MAKPKANSKANPSVPNKHLYSRLSYLHQAAMFLGAQAHKAQAQAQAVQPPKSSSQPEKEGGRAPTSQNDSSRKNQGVEEESKEQTRLKLARYLMTNFRATSLKSQIRVSPAIKRTTCKFCDALLVEGRTSTSVVENASKGGRKPWADVLVVRCLACGGAKRFPVGAERQKRRHLRGQAIKGVATGQSGGGGGSAAKMMVVVERPGPASESATASASVSVVVSVAEDTVMNDD
ncbi:RNAse P Rpr2/Rpp21/SNM1 subunit domain-containing protein [Xylariaceae sp. FL0594]|nr:RNAse P Rpr2/Rpp21/SNM1 subunit domain-containing protein [Xylariaceae sp. FL0594]